MNTVAAPVQQHERISSLDALRGFALLGILLMNIVGFALHPAAYGDPTVAGGGTGINIATWVVMHILAEGKMRCLFSMVFGAGIILITSRAKERAAGVATADIYFRRNLWLGVFGLAHAFLLWEGEILYPYALCALPLFVFRNLPARALVRIAAASLILLAASAVFRGYDTRNTIASGQAAIAAQKSGAKLTAEQTKAREKYENLLKDAKPSREEIERVNRAMSGGYWSALKERAGHVLRWHALAYYHPANWDIWSMMLLGMGLFKLGVFSAEKSYRFYGWMAAAGYALGISVNSITAYLIVRSQFDLVTASFSGISYDVGRLAIALAHMAVVMMLCKANALSWLMRTLAAIGQTAFSNYVLQSVICCALFNIFGLFGKLERHQLYFVVAGIWAISTVASPIWLRHYRFGPLEWVWRSLTYWQRQPMRRSGPLRASAAA